jgi:hypothetical protein
MVEENMTEENDSIAWAATSWNPAFPGRNEVSRKEARQARAAMQLAHDLDTEPSEALKRLQKEKMIRGWELDE